MTAAIIPTLTKNPQDPKCEIIMKADYIPADQIDGLAAVGETIVYDIESTNTGNVEITQVTMLDSVGKYQATKFLKRSTASERNFRFTPVNPQQIFWSRNIARCGAYQTSGQGSDRRMSAGRASRFLAYVHTSKIL